MRSFWDRLFKDDLSRAKQELLMCQSFVRIAIHSKDKKQTVQPIYNVYEFDHKNGRMNYFMLDREGNFSMQMPSSTDVEFIDAGRHDLIPYNHEFNRKLSRLYLYMDNNREELRGQRIYVGNCARTNEPVYLTTSGQYHKLRSEEQKYWPAELPFKYIALNRQAPGIEHYYSFGYYATRGTTTIIPNVSATWEPDPWYRDFQQEREAKLIQEYNEYLQADHFRRGDLIQCGTAMPEVFIRYLDEDRTAMVLYPAGKVKGIRKIMSYKLLQRGYRPTVEESELKES
ncbi:hypothetical protein D3C81_237700 [compost metagenome]